MHVAALFKVNYDIAYAGWTGVKAGYITPAAWILSYLITLMVAERWWLPHFLGQRWRLGKTFSLCLVAAFLCINAWYLVY